MAANYIVVVEKEGSEPIVVGFETAEEAESWCKTINDADERVWGGGFHHYARTPVQPLNPTEAAKKILDEAENELGLDSDGETAVDAEGNIWRHMHQEHDGECACYWYWDSPEGRWVTRDLPCAHRDLQHPLYAAEFEDDDGVYWFRPGQDRTFRVPSWNITNLPGHWTHWGRPSIEEQPREFTFDVKFELQERFGHEPQKLAVLDEADVEALELGHLLRQYWDLRENMSYHETRLNEPRRSPHYRTLLEEITPIQQQLAERGVTPEILDEAERRLSRGEFRVNPKGDSRMYPIGHWTRETLTVGRWVKQNTTPVEVGGEAVKELLGW